ncbi:MAG: PspC domain-containing protein [Fusobacteriaceae bacterium]|jgi:phage shock protein PspC (stress-responsive transcriptional regulator)|nr:PspC domain-containing protein [Fusobacteriaceae bacterium]MBP6468380.1 PspC domain-containing protein [Fusobacteriaceae bacterium]MBP9597246.1 PspC domain-containing protein [Fusobacteriaceae bacterium]
MAKKLTRSRTDRKLAGVCGGIAEFFDVDVTVIRILWVLATFLGGSGLLAYIICALLMPEGDF